MKGDKRKKFIGSVAAVLAAGATIGFIRWKYNRKL